MLYILICFMQNYWLYGIVDFNVFEIASSIQTQLIPISLLSFGCSPQTLRSEYCQMFCTGFWNELICQGHLHCSIVVLKQSWKTHNIDFSHKKWDLDCMGHIRGVKKLEWFNNQNDRISPGCNISCPLYRTLISFEFTSYTTQSRNVLVICQKYGNSK